MDKPTKEIEIGTRVTFIRRDADGHKITLWGKVTDIRKGVAIIEMPWGIAREPVDNLKFDTMEEAHQRFEERREKKLEDRIATALAGRGEAENHPLRCGVC